MLSLVCVLESSPVGEPDPFSEPFSLEAVLAPHGFPFSLSSSTALLLSLGFVSCTLLIILVLQEQIRFMFPLLTKR